MNVTAVGNESVVARPSSQATTGDTEAFSQALSKQLHSSKETPKEDAKDTSSELSDEKEDIEESQDFIIIPTFLRFETHSELSKMVMGEGLNSDNSMTERAVTPLNTQPVIDGEVIIADDEAPDLETPVSDTTMVETSVSESTVVETSVTDNSANNTPTVDAVVTDSGLEQLTPNQDDPDVIAKQVTPRVSDSSIEQPLAEFNTGHIDTPSIDSLPLSALTEQGELTDGVTEGQILDSDEGDTGISQTSVTPNPQPTQTIERALQTESGQTTQPVTLEESPDMIQDFILTTASSESGDKVYQSTLTLTPETLGQITVELTFSEEGLTGRLVFDTDEAKQWVENQWQQIKTPLELKGLSLDTIDFQVVKPQDTMTSTPFNLSHQSDQSKKEEQGKRKNTRLASHQLEDESRPTEAILRHGYGLNYYA